MHSSLCIVSRGGCAGTGSFGLPSIVCSVAMDSVSAHVASRAWTMCSNASDDNLMSESD